MTMDIYTKNGTKVIYTGKNGYEADREKANQYLEVGKEYTVMSVDIGSSMSYVQLEECPEKCFNTVMFDEKEKEIPSGKRPLWDTMEEFAEQMQIIADRYESECDEYWDKLDYEEKLKAFYSVCKRIYKADVVDQGSYRYSLYEVFGFGADAYVVGMECNYMDIHNYIQDGVASHKEYVEKKNENDL